jgi:hypothetical protein
MSRQAATPAATLSANEGQAEGKPEVIKLGLTCTGGRLPSAGKWMGQRLSQDEAIIAISKDHSRIRSTSLSVLCPVYCTASFRALVPVGAASTGLT